MDTTEFTIEGQKWECLKMVARIGQGEKAHPVLVRRKISETGERGPFFGLMFVCSCPGTHSGSAVHRAQLIGGSTHESRTCR